MPATHRLRNFVRALRALKWLGISAAGTFVLSAGLAFSAVYFRAPGHEQLPERFPPGAGFGMQLRPEGDGLLLTWNGGLAGTYKANGLLLIDDAAQHREIQLDRDELISGVMLYRAASNDVLFRLRLSDGDGRTLVDRVRKVSPVPRP